MYKVDRVDYKMIKTSVKGPLSSLRYGQSAAGNQSYGWFSVSLILTWIIGLTRIDYAQ